MFSIHRKLFSFEKGSNFQKHSSSGSLNPVKKPPTVKFLIPPTREGEFTSPPPLLITIWTGCICYKANISPENFISKQHLCKLCVNIAVPNFNTLWRKPYSIYTYKLWNFPTCFWWPQRQFSSLCPDKIRKTKKNEKQHFSEA